MANVRTDGTYKGRNETMLMFMDFWLSWRKFLRKEGQMQHDNDNYGYSGILTGGNIGEP